jgi:hypothetical protein
MAKTLLNSVNEILKRVSLIAGDSGLLTSLTDTARQVAIDVAVQVVNEGIDELYAASNVAKPNGQGESTITLATSDRSYPLSGTGFVRLRWPMVDKTNTQFLHQFPGGYDAMLLSDPEQDDTGLPVYAAINPVNGELHLDRAPTSVENGRVYTYQYDKDVSLTAAADTVPFKDIVFRAMVPAWVQLWKRERRNEFDGDLYRISIGRAATLMTQIQPRDSWSPR